MATIRANPKSYPNWQHRRWLLQKFAGDEESKQTLVPGELDLISKLLKLDPRNCTRMLQLYTNMFSSRLELSDMAGRVCIIICHGRV